MNEVEDEILVSSMVGFNTREGVVQIVWGAKEGQLGIEQAERHALAIFQAAAAARFDETLIKLLVAKPFDLEFKQAGQVLHMLRTARAAAEGDKTATMTLSDDDKKSIELASGRELKRSLWLLGEVMGKIHPDLATAVVVAFVDSVTAKPDDGIVTPES